MIGCPQNAQILVEEEIIYDTGLFKDQPNMEEDHAQEIFMRKLDVALILEEVRPFSLQTTNSYVIVNCFHF